MKKTHKYNLDKEKHLNKQKIYFNFLKLFKQNCRYCIFKSNSYGLCSACLKYFKYSLNPSYQYINSMKVITLSRYMSGIKEEILNFKLRNQREISKQFIISIFNYPNLVSDISKYEYITYVPMDKAKEKYYRGYNQSKILAKELSMFFGIPVIDLIEKVKKNKTQSSVRSKDRKDNVKGVYRIKEGYSFNNILVIDDIYTTGATLLEIRKQIKMIYNNVTIASFVLSKTISIKGKESSLIDKKKRYFKLKDRKKLLRKRILEERHSHLNNH